MFIPDSKPRLEPTLFWNRNINIQLHKHAWWHASYPIQVFWVHISRSFSPSPLCDSSPVEFEPPGARCLNNQHAWRCTRPTGYAIISRVPCNPSHHVWKLSFSSSWCHIFNNLPWSLAIAARPIAFFFSVHTPHTPLHLKIAWLT